MNKQSMTSLAFKGILIGSFAVSLTLSSCGGGASTQSNGKEAAETTASAAPTDVHYKLTDLVDLDLSAHGLPVIVKAPKDAKVIPYSVNGDICIYGGKFFKITVSQMDGALDQNLGTMKAIVADKEMNPSFDKFEVEDDNSFLKRNTKGELAFLSGMQWGEKTVFIADGIPFDISPDQFTDYPAEDVKLMYEAAKLAVEKK